MTNVLLGDVATFPPSRPTASEGEVEVQTVTSGCLKPSGFDPRGIRPNRMHREDVDAATIRPREVLVGRSNTGDLVGRSAVVPDDMNGVVASDLVFRIVAGPQLEPEYLARLLAAIQLSGYWVDRSRGASSTMKKITRAQLRNLEFDLPSPDRQRQVAGGISNQLAAHDLAERAVSSRDSEASSLRARVMASCFGRDVPLSVLARPPTYQVGWSWQLLTNLAQLETGHTPSRGRPDWWVGEIGWIALPDVRRLDGQVAVVTSETTNAEGIANSSARILPTDTVVMSRTASVGFVTRMGRPMATSQDFVNWVCGPDLDPEFLMHLFDPVTRVRQVVVERSDPQDRLHADRQDIPGVRAADR